MVENKFIKHYGKKFLFFCLCKSDPKKSVVKDQKRPKC